MAKTNKSRFAVLGMLLLDPSSGYDIKTKMQQSIFNFWRESDSSIYPILRELTKEKLVTLKQISSTGKREKKIYAVTEKGKKQFLNWLEIGATFEPPRRELLLKLFFGGFAPLEVSRKHLKEFERRLLTGQEKLKEIKQLLEKEHKKDPHLPFWKLTLRCGEEHVEADLKWCKEALKELS